MLFIRPLQFTHTGPQFITKSLTFEEVNKESLEVLGKGMTRHSFLIVE